LVFGETDYTSLHAVRFFISKDQQPLVFSGAETPTTKSAISIP